MKKNVRLYNWIKNSYFKNLMIPLIILEVFFVSIFFISINTYKNSMMKSMKKEVIKKLSDIAELHSAIISTTFLDVSNYASTYGKQILRALNSQTQIEEINASRLGVTDKGVIFTTKDKKEGGAAVFYSGYVPIKKDTISKIHRVLKTESFMKDTQNVDKLIASIYFNSYDSLNVIYPYFDVLSQYETHMNIPKFNFYYEADLSHNPSKKTVWTEAYLDPAGHGWMISAISPVYNNDFLEGVVGIDMTIDTIVKRIKNFSMPWKGYALLVDDQGVILALPELGEKDFNILELKDHSYKESIKKDTFKPEEFNLLKKKEFLDFSSKIKNTKQGVDEIYINNESKIMAWATVEETNWKLMLIISKEAIYNDIYEVTNNLNRIGGIIIGILVILQTIVGFSLIRRSKFVATTLISPLSKVNEAIANINDGIFFFELEDSEIIEISETTQKVKKLGETLKNNIAEREKAQSNLFAYQSSLEKIIEERTDNLIQANNDLKQLQSQIIEREKLVSIGQLAAGLAHEINNPVSFINANINTLQNYIDIILSYVKNLESNFLNSSNLQIKEDIEKLKSQIQFDFIIDDLKDIFLDSKLGIDRVSSIINSLKDFSNLNNINEMTECNINKGIEDTLIIIKSEYDSIKIKLDLEPNIISKCFMGEINQVILNLLLNSIYSIKEKYSNNEGLIEISSKKINSNVIIKIKDNGMGIPEEIKNLIFNPFFSTKPIGKGTGLGLSIAYDIIVNKHKGTINFVSEIGEYTDFIIAIPTNLDSEND